MVWFGPDKRVRLAVDLTRYHAHLVEGLTGTVLQGVQVDEWTSLDRFGAVRFDRCGHVRSILTESLEILGDAPARPRNAIPTEAPMPLTALAAMAFPPPTWQGGTERQLRAEEYYGFALEETRSFSWIAKDASGRVVVTGSNLSGVKTAVRAYLKYGQRLRDAFGSILEAEGIPIIDLGFEAGSFGMSWTIRVGLPEREEASRVRYDLRKSSNGG